MESYVYMKGSDYIKAIIHSKLLILVLVIASVVVVGVMSYLKIPPYKVSVLIKPGSFLSDNGLITPLVTPGGLERLISDGIFDRSVCQSLKLDPQKPLEIRTILPQGTDVVLVIHETRDPVMGLKVVNALIGQLASFYEKERQEKLQTVQSKYMDSIKKQTSQADLESMKKLNEIGRLKSDLTKMKREPKGDDLAVKNMAANLSEKQKEYRKLDQEKLLLKKQFDALTKIIHEGKSIQVIQEPMVVPSGYKIRIAQNMLSAAVISLVIGLLLSFILYDLRMNRKS
ncbi:MAG: hypothetical protein NTZ24_15335 [Deltaproteobacteria bacterium]|nr:hypothetical protein [Deltaproteobacteria bacterium]